MIVYCFYLSVAEHAIVENHVKSLSLLSYGVSQMFFFFVFFLDAVLI